MATIADQVTAIRARLAGIAPGKLTDTDRLEVLLVAQLDALA